MKIPTPRFYILKGETPILCGDVPEWTRQFQTANRVVAKTRIGNVRISTVFLGIDFNSGDGPPLLFETMIFGSPRYAQYQIRCSTWKQAKKQHAEAVDLVRAK
jgi:hypothetical protein